ncbi:glycosyltransferase family 4 protein [Anabaena subtropica]|uniref:Glycosyltransferase family 4 protein n=1 Tax=Anabaena subtropica FACHB-260 TaxID=2692884 RepID=A0ABR8CJL2_9NOST|nr:glycosyltransferase family 4 protein [Anabaena subtropica]MBD2343426.1 glycosyltransferase family 4 protein [Anabaena subtropica FACHB-260]
MTLSSEVCPLRFIVIQMGARMHYAVPALLARHGMLEHFYTDICSNVGFSGIISHLLPNSIRPQPVKRFLGRKLPPEIQPSQVTTVPLTTLTNFVAQNLQTRGINTPSVINPELKILQRVLKDNLSNANSLYTNCINSDIEVVQKAKDKGISIVHEVIINADVGRILRDERNLYPGIEMQDDLDEVEEGIKRDLKKWEMSDLILVPSDFVYDRTVKLGGKADKIVTVPYGIDQDWFNNQPNPQRGRVLFVGSVSLRKGNHYLAQATRILQKRKVNCDVRVVGPYEPQAIEHPEFLGPDYVGQCPRTHVRKEFLEADIFVLPTLSDSFALVHLEAMACGVPVITTPNCGSVVRDGVDGFIVPIRDAQTLADRIEQLLTDNNLRNQMSQNAKARAKEFTWEKYGQRLMDAFKKLAK